MRTGKKKTSKDYGLFCLRLSQSDREELTSLLDKAKERLNRDRKPEEYVRTKNQILFEAVKLGLPLIKKGK